MNYEEIKKSLDSAIMNYEIKVEEGSSKMYSVDEVLAILYSIRDCE